MPTSSYRAESDNIKAGMRFQLCVWVKSYRCTINKANRWIVNMAEKHLMLFMPLSKVHSISPAATAR